MSEIDFDRDAVLAAFKSAVTEAWNRLRALDPPERIYGLGFFDSSGYGYMGVSGFTEEGLDRVVEHYRGLEWGARYAGPEGRERMRWATGDSPYHVITDVTSPPLVDHDDVHQHCGDDGEDGGAKQRYQARIQDLAVQALVELDREGLFEPEREDLMLFLEDVYEEQSPEDFRRIVADLNPPEVFKRFLAFERKLERDRAAEDS